MFVNKKTFKFITLGWSFFTLCLGVSVVFPEEGLWIRVMVKDMGALAVPFLAGCSGGIVCCSGLCL